GPPGAEDPGARRQPRFLQLIGVIDLENRVLLYHAEQHEQAQRRKDVERLPEEDYGKERERQRERQRQQNRNRVQPRLELRRQNQVHKDEREQEREHEILGSPSKLARPAAQTALILVAGTQ